MLIRTPALSILDWGYLSSATSGTGNAGTIELTLGSLDLQNGGRIYSDSLGVGRAGSVTVNAEQAISVLGSYSSISSNAHSTGDGGSVLITTPYLTLNSGELSCYTLGNGLGGSIRIDAREMRLTNEASISSESKGTGNAGNISVTADMLHSDNAFITTEALKAAGGNIHLEARDLILTDRSAVTASVAAGEGGGGNVSIKANVLVALDDSDITAKADQGYGGNITIDALSVFTTKDVNFDASSNVTGREGKVEVRSPVTDISSSIVDLPAAFLNIDAFLPKQCAEREEEASSFVVRGRDGLPPQPESLFAGQ